MKVKMKKNLFILGGSAEIRRTVQGEISLRGQNLFHESLDLDLMLKKYERSQNFNLVDVGAFFVAGPLGTLLTKGYTFGSVYEESLGGKSTILKLVSDWKIKNGVAEAEDVALSTKQSRVAMKGRLDFVNEQFDEVMVAVVDEKGCVRFSQKIHGPFRHPRVEKAGTVRSIAGPFMNLYVKTKKLLQGGRCEIFYTGSVKHPK
jgi:AsmA protein